MAVEGFKPTPGPGDRPQLSDVTRSEPEIPQTGIFALQRPTDTDFVREAAGGHALAHPDAEIPSKLRRQITAAESHIIADARLAEATTVEERVALENVKEGVDKQIRGIRSLTTRERVVRGIGIGAATAAVVIPAGKAAIDSASQIPDLAADRAVAELPVEVGTQQVDIFGVEVTVPSIEETLEIREERVAEAQAALDDAVEDTGRNAATAGIAFLAGAAAMSANRRGVDPVGAARRFFGRRQEEAGWRDLGESKEDLKARYNKAARDQGQ